MDCTAKGQGANTAGRRSASNRLPVRQALRKGLRFIVAILSIAVCFVAIGTGWAQTHQGAEAVDRAQRSPVTSSATSRVKEAERWRQEKLKSLHAALATATGSQKEELRSQVRWLEAWQPGGLGDRPLWNSGNEARLHPEPILDPNHRASSLREKLLQSEGEDAANALRQLRRKLELHADDIGLQQLYLHWLDQPQYRKQRADQIADVAESLARQLSRTGERSEQLRWAEAYCWYRAGRALAYRELPDVVAQSPIADPERHDARLRQVAARLGELMGDDRPEFVLLRVRMLRRDRLFGRALVELENYGNAIDKKWLLKKRRDLLRELQWDPPANEAAIVFARHYPEQAHTVHDATGPSAPRSDEQ